MRLPSARHLRTMFAAFRGASLAESGLGPIAIVSIAAVGVTDHRVEIYFCRAAGKLGADLTCDEITSGETPTDPGAWRTASPCESSTPHEMAFARQVGTRLIFMEHGKISVDGHPAEILSRPPSDRLRDFLQHVE